MADSTIHTKEKKIGSEFFKSTASYIHNAAKEYFSEAMPVTTSIQSDVKSSFVDIHSNLKSKSSEIFGTVRDLKKQVSFKNILKWYTTNGEEYDSELGANYDQDLNFDVDTSDADISSIEINENEKNATKVAKSVVESSHQLAEATLASTANILTNLDRQTAEITARLDRTNDTLNKILEVVTKNTATLIEENAVDRSGTDPNAQLLGGGKFDFNAYKNMVKNNLENSPLGIVTSMAGMLNPMMAKEALSPKEIVKNLFAFGMNKAAPNLKKNLSALDEVVNKTIMDSLIRLGTKGNDWTLSGMIGKYLGIDSTRKRIDTSRSSIELKAVPFDTISKEAITNAIPGYLRKILVALGGPDVVYDYRSRSFRTQNSINKEFAKSIASTNTLYQMAPQAQRYFKNDNFTNASLDMLSTVLGSDLQRANSSNGFFKHMDDPKYVEKFLLENVFVGEKLNGDTLKRVKYLADSIADSAKGRGRQELLNVTARNNVMRNQRASAAVHEYDRYNIDLSSYDDSLDNQVKAVKSYYGISSKTNNNNKLTGLDYTNVALYEIFRRLDTGINVYKQGENTHKPRDKAYKRFGDQYLKKPENYRAKKIMDDEAKGNSLIIDMNAVSGGGKNKLRAELDENSNPTKPVEDRIFDWIKERGGGLGKAIISGDPEQVKTAFAATISDITSVAGDQVKKGISKINQSFGNVTGYVKHKLFGTAYKYADGVDEEGNPIYTYIKENKKGGIFGFAINGIKNSLFGKEEVDENGNIKGKNGVFTKLTNYFKDVAKMFDDGDKEKDKNKNNKAHKFASTALGAVIGASMGGGIIAAPIAIIAGGLVGHAFSGTEGIGDKISNLLFGEKDANGKRQRGGGIIGKFTHKIVDPIAYQFEKTTKHLGASLKKRIFGPIADIGTAIKNAAVNRAKTAFEKVFNVLTAPFRLLGKGIAKAVTGVTTKLHKGGATVLGGLVRTAGGAAGETSEGILEMIANIIDPSKEGKEKRKANRAARKKEFKNWDTMGKYKDWQKKKDEEYYNRDQEAIKEYTEEVKMNSQEIKEYEKKQLEMAKESAEREKNIDASTAKLLHEATHHTPGKGSLQTHDTDLIGRVDKILKYLAGSRTEKTTSNEISNPETNEVNSGATLSSIENTASNAIKPITGIGRKAQKAANRLKVKAWKKEQAKKEDNASVHGESATREKINEKKRNHAQSIFNSASNIASNAGVGSEESRLLDVIQSEANKDDPNISKMQNAFTKLKSLNGENKDENKKEERNFFSDLFSMIGGIGSFLTSPLGIAGVIAGILALTGNAESIFNIVGNIASGIGNIIGFITGDKKGIAETNTAAGMNAVTALGDFQAKNEWDYVNPTASLYHNKKDAAGNLITNSAATTAKNQLAFGVPFQKAQWGVATADYNLNKAIKYENKANTYTAKAATAKEGNFWQRNVTAKYDEAMAKKYTDKSEAQLNKAIQKENGVGTFVKGVASNAATVGMIGAGSNITGGIASGVAGALGADDETKENVGRIATGATAAALTVKNAKGIMTGKGNLAEQALSKVEKTKLGSKVVNGFKDFITKLGEKIVEKAGKNGAFKKIANSALTKTIKNFTSKLSAKITESAIGKIMGSIVARLGVAAAKEAAGVASLGIGIAVGAVIGALSGGCSTEHLFGVLPGKADAGMIAISSVLGAAFGAIEMIPGVGLIVTIMDILDGFIIAPIFGRGIKQFIAQSLYSLFGGAENLEKQQAAFEAERQYYNQKYGADLSTSDMNDKVNRTGFLDRIWHGENAYDENGHLKFDDAGGNIDTGMSTWFVGGENAYAKDANGSVIKNAETGQAVLARDAKGHVIKKDMKWGDHVGNFFGDVGHFFGGGDVYKTDENGQALVDENGNYVVDHTDKNIFQNAWDGLKNVGASIHQGVQDIGKGIGDFFGGLFGQKKTEESKEIEKTEAEISKVDTGFDSKEKESTKKGGGLLSLVGTISGKIHDVLFNPVKAVADGISDLTKDDEYMKDEKGNYILDEKGNKVKKSGLKSFIHDAAESVSNFFAGPISWIGGLFGGNKDKAASGGEDAVQSTGNAIADEERRKSQSARDEISSSRQGGNPLSVPSKISVSSDYWGGWGGTNSPYTRQNPHKGLDIVPEVWGTKADVVSRWNGTVTHVEKGVNGFSKNQAAGNNVSILTKDENGNVMTVRHMHLAPGSIPDNIVEGSEVRVGDKLGIMGETGYAYGKHLHYQFNKGDYNGAVTLNDTYDPSKSYNGKSGSTIKNPGTSMFKNDTTTQSTDPITSIINNVKTGASNVWNGIKTFASNAWEGTKNFIGGVVNGIKNWFSGSVTNNISDKDLDKLKQSTSNLSISINIPGGRFGGDGALRAALSIDADKPIMQLSNANMNAILKPGMHGLILDLTSGYEFEVVIKDKPNTTNSIFTPINNAAVSIAMKAAKYKGNKYLSWEPRPALLKVDNKQIAIAIDNHPHGSIVDGANPGNPYINRANKPNNNGYWDIGGHHVMFFSDSRQSRITPSKIDSVKYREMVVTAFDVAQKLRKEQSHIIDEMIKDPEFTKSNNEIWTYLHNIGYSDAAIAAIMGNLYADSGLNPGNLDNYYNSRFNMTDQEYTDEANKLFTDQSSGSSFLYDGAGYGLAQWHTKADKQRFFEGDRKKGDGGSPSVADQSIQLSMLASDLKDRYKDTMLKIKTTKSAKEAAEMFLMDPTYGAGKDHGLIEKARRAKYANAYLKKYGNSASISETQGAKGGEVDDVPNSYGNIRESSYQTSSVPNSNSSSSNSFRVDNHYDSRYNDAILEALNSRKQESNKSNEKIESMLSKLVTLLESIDGNTDMSNSLLGSIDQKGFADGELRNTINAMGKVMNDHTKKLKKSALSGTTQRKTSQLIQMTRA